MKDIFRRKALFVFRDHCRRSVSGARDAPIWVRDHVNRKLSEMPDYRNPRRCCNSPFLAWRLFGAQRQRCQDQR
jgi:hypothetical protein